MKDKLKKLDEIIGLKGFNIAFNELILKGDCESALVCRTSRNKKYSYFMREYYDSRGDYFMDYFDADGRYFSDDEVNLGDSNPFCEDGIESHDTLFRFYARKESEYAIFSEEEIEDLKGDRSIKILGTIKPRSETRARAMLFSPQRNIASKGFLSSCIELTNYDDKDNNFEKFLREDLKKYGESKILNFKYNRGVWRLK